MNEPVFSVRRCAMLRRCRREYYIHYCFAASETDPDDPDKTEKQRLYRLKKLAGLDSYCAELCSDALRELLSGGDPDWKGALLRRAGREFNSMLLGRSEQDHSLPQLRELYYSELTPDRCFALLKQRLTDFADALNRNPDFLALIRCDAAVRPVLPAPAEFLIGSVKLYSTPLTAARVGRSVVFWECAAPESFAVRALFHRYWAVFKLRRDLGNVISRFIAPNGAVTTFAPEELDVSAELERMNAVVAEEQELAVFEGLTPHAIPGGRRCGHCRFREYCSEPF